jgi:hypothetical protein
VVKLKAKWIALILVIILSFVGLVYFFGLGGAVAAFFESLLLFAISNPDKTAGYLASFYKMLRNVNFWFERSAVEKRLESSIGLSSKKLNNEGVVLLPHGVNVKWVESKDRDAFLKENKIVVCLESSANEARNLARATFLYASEDLIRESQRFIDSNVMKSACFAVSRKMLMYENRLDALKCLKDEFLEPEIEEHPSIEELLAIMENLDSEGIFTRVLLKEFSELDAKLHGTLTDHTAMAETLTFMNTMKRLSEKEKGIDVNPDHRGTIIDVSIMLIAREGKRDPNPYIKYAKKCWDLGVPRLYILAQGVRIEIALASVLGVKTLGIYRIDREWKYTITSQKKKFESYVAVLSRIAS